MHNMHHTDMFMAPLWVVYTLGAVFLAGACFYLFRLLSPSTVKKVYGYHDWENEVGHGLCMLAMAGALAPAALQLPAIAWTVTLGAGCLWFLARALTWGRKLAHNKVWWWDWAHVGMLGGMALMFTPVNLGGWFTVVQAAFWLWFASYYMYETYHELKDPKLLYMGSNFSHLLMGVVMFVMTLWPMALMPTHNMSMPGMNTPAHTQPAQPHNHSASAAVKADDKNFSAEVLHASHAQPVVVLIHGGCEKCATELPIFEQLAPKYQGRAKFVRVNEDISPNTCKLLQVKECPAVLVVKNGQVLTSRLTEVADEARLQSFIDTALKD